MSNEEVRSIQLVGLLLWRGGLLFAASWAFYEGARWALQFFDLPRLVEVGISLVISGAILVFVSLILERSADARKEGDLGR